ncbi:ArsR family transcriptional regulator [Gammaproteobacteria bacterium]|nr:ArsR family transcriptional regulator [Gammaproteobacteria bacterium]
MKSEDLSFNQVNLSKRTKQCLKLMRIENLIDITNFSESDFLAQKNFGKKCLTEVRLLLDQKNLKFKQEDDSSLRYRIEVRQKIKQEKFQNNERYRKIIDEWNKTSKTLEEIAEPLNITRERVRQILSKAKSYGLFIKSKDSKFNERSSQKKNKFYEKYRDQFIKLYPSHSIAQIASKLKISTFYSQSLEKKLLEEGLIKKPLVRPIRHYVNKTKEHRKEMILSFRKEEKTLDEIALILGVSKPTVANDIREMKKDGLIVPFSRETGQKLSQEEIDLRSYFIEDKLAEGWSKKKIAKALGLSEDGSAINRHIKLHL